MCSGGNTSSENEFKYRKGEDKTMAKKILFKLLLSLALSMLPTHALDEDVDFLGHMENLERLEKEREREMKMYEAHEVSKYLQTASLY